MVDETVAKVLEFLANWSLDDNTHSNSQEYATAFIDEGNLSDLESAKKISSQEILNTYKIVQCKVLTYLNINEFPDEPIVYIASCMWTAGELVNRYDSTKEVKNFMGNTQTMTEYSPLIGEAKEMLMPYICYNCTALSDNTCKCNKKEVVPDITYSSSNIRVNISSKE